MKSTRVLAILLCVVMTPVYADNGAEEVRVMTRNLYVGADIFRVVEAPDPGSALLEIIGVYNTVQQTDFPSRAVALADEIAATDPHVVGLQEVALIRTQTPGDVLVGNPLPATDVEYDYLQLLLDELALRGLQYTVASAVDNADVELPLFGGPDIRDVRLTDRDVLLVRNDIFVTESQAGNFESFVEVDLSGLQIEFLRGYNTVVAWIGSRPYRFVNVHLETGGDFGAAIQQLQATELVSLFADEFLPVIMLGDFNAGPQSAPAQAYGQLIDAGHVDAWTLASPEPGLTCCHSETLDDPNSVLTSRIDLVLARNAGPVAVNAAEVVGDEVADITEGGLWPSDHAGVYASLNIAIGDTDGDTVNDLADNCVLVANPDQRDTDSDGFGNLCDADLNQNGFTNFADLALFRQAFFSDDPDADFDGNQVVDFNDLVIFKTLFGRAPGPVAPQPPP